MNSSDPSLLKQPPNTSNPFFTQELNMIAPAPNENFDWAASDAIDVKSISYSSRNKAFIRFLKTFMDAKSFTGGNITQLSHLLHILQQSLNYFIQNHEIMRKQLNLREAQLNSLSQQIEDLKRQGQIEPGRDIYYCPICLAEFDSYDLVDTHVQVQHPTLFDKWKEIRHPVEKSKVENYASMFSAEIQPGVKKITQSDAIDALGDQLQKKMKRNQMSFQDLRSEMNARFQEFIDIIKANEFTSAYADSYETSMFSTTSTSNHRRRSRSSSSRSSHNHEKTPPPYNPNKKFTSIPTTKKKKIPTSPFHLLPSPESQSSGAPDDSNHSNSHKRDHSRKRSSFHETPKP